MSAPKKRRPGRPYAGGPGTPVMIRLHDELLTPLDRVVAASGLDRSTILRAALRQYLDDLAHRDRDDDAPAAPEG